MTWSQKRTSWAGVNCPSVPLRQQTTH